MHKTLGQRDPALAFPLARTRDDAGDRRQANRAVAVSAIGLGVTGLAELLLAVLTGSVGLLGDAIHNLSDVSTSAVVFVGFRLSRRPPTEKYPYGLERAEDLAGVGIAVVIWASAAFAGYESIRKLIGHGHTAFVGAGIAGAVLGIAGNQVVARYKLTVGRRINSATLIADARHSWLDALSSAGALAGLIAVALGQPWGDPVAGLAVTAFICHVGYEVTTDVMHRLADGVDPDVITRAEAAAGSVPGVIHAHARARWTGRTLRVEIEGWVDPELSARDADVLGRLVADEISHQLPEAGAFTWTTQALGYDGSYPVVRDYLARQGPARKPLPPAPPTVRDVTNWLSRRPDTLTEDEKPQLQAILDRCPELQAASGQVRAFATMITKLTGQDLPQWMAAAREAGLPGIASFAKGLEQDLDAVTNGLTMPWSSGPVEGRVNHIKMVKRQMFGRAGLPLLRKRVLLTARNRTQPGLSRN